MSKRLSRMFALCGVLIAFAAAAVPTIASARDGNDNVPQHHGEGSGHK